MIMSSFKKIAISNQRIFLDSHSVDGNLSNGEIMDKYVDYLSKISKYVDYLILREKDLDRELYEKLAEKLLKCCDEKLILHNDVDAALHVGGMLIHLPMDIFRKEVSRLGGFVLKGASAHSLEDAHMAEEMGADYITFSHVFPTECKKGLKPRGLDMLCQVCHAVKIPVYALGGINDENEQQVYAAGAAGACRMSDYMNKNV